MTAVMFQEELCRELERIFEGSIFKDSTGKYGKIKVYEQNLPIPESDDEPDPAPYIIVRLESGKTETGVDPQEVEVTLIINYFDDSMKNSGHKGVLGIIQKIYERFEKEPILEGGYYFMDPFEWALQDEPSFPNFIGVAGMTFGISAIRRESEYA